MSDLEYSLYAAAQTPTAGNVIFDARQPLVTNYYNQGEFLNYLRFAANTVYGTSTPIDIGAQPISRALALHSMNLHAAFLFDDRLRALAKEMPALIPGLLDTTLFASDPNGRTKDLITSLVNDQIRQGLSTTSALERFTTDLLQLESGGGTTTPLPIQKALIVAAMEYYYVRNAADATALFATTDGFVNFRLDSIGTDATKLKTPGRLANAVWSLAGDAGIFAEDAARSSSSWHVQIGNGPMNWSSVGADDDAAIGGAGGDNLDGGGGNDVLLGLAGSDSLTGGGGTDVLVGGDDNDTLDGGTGPDYLYGGAGSDTYSFTGAFGGDWVVDGDGAGIIQVDGLQLTGGKKVSAGVYQDDAGGWTYVLAGTNLILSKSGSLNQITIRGWTAGQLGITLDESPAAVAPATNTYTGDYTKKVVPATPTVYDFTDANYTKDGAQANAQDLLTGTDSADELKGLGGNDGLSGGGGDDLIDGGDGDDLLFGGAGRDTINGGAGVDFIYGAGVGNLTYPLQTTDAPPVATGAEYTRGFSWVTYDGGIDSNQLQTYVLDSAEFSYAAKAWTSADSGIGSGR
jgi:hypothetical protein